MCGIVGYVGTEKAADIVYEGLKRLEYRGYDSAGIAIVQENKIRVVRSVGKLSALRAKTDSLNGGGTIGIGHTRWATHGEPSEKNAHPHLDCTGSIVVIHNGIVENYLELKKKLIDSGHHFKSDTDSEVIVHLIEENWRDCGDADLLFATGKALGVLDGAHAILVLSSRVPGSIFAFRIGHAGGIAIGEGEGEMFIASDIPAILPHTRKLVFLENMEMAEVRKGSFSTYTLDGTRCAKEYINIPWDPVSAAKGNYNHFMQKEIYEQSLSLTDTLRNRLDIENSEIHFGHFDVSDEEIQSIEKIVIVACGTSYYAGLTGKYILETLCHIPVEVDYGSEFRYRDPIIDEKTFVLALSQSGETVDTLAAIEEARKKNALLGSIVNVPGSQISRICRGIIYMHAGPEIGVASTKAFTSTLTDLFLLGFYLAQKRNLLSLEERAKLIDCLIRIPKLIGDILEEKEIYQALMNRFYEATDFLFLGRGINYPIALEGAHKLKEISYIHAEGCPAGEMKHGINALIDKHLPVVAIATADSHYPKMLSNIQQVKARDGKVIALVSKGDEDVTRIADYVITVPFVHSLLNPILNVVPLQLIAYYIALKRGCDIDQPRNLAKSVTVE